MPVWLGSQGGVAAACRATAMPPPPSTPSNPGGWVVVECRRRCRGFHQGLPAGTAFYGVITTRRDGATMDAALSIVGSRGTGSCGHQICGQNHQMRILDLDTDAGISAECTCKAAQTYSGAWWLCVTCMVSRWHVDRVHGKGKRSLMSKELPWKGATGLLMPLIRSRAHGCQLVIWALMAQCWAAACLHAKV